MVGIGTEGSKAPLLSVIVLQWDQVHHTRRCVDSIREGTDVDYELIIVDNGSEPPGRMYAADTADVVVQHDRNLGFAGGMNAGLRQARGSVVAFVNNDTTLPSGWAFPLVQLLETDSSIGIVTPAISASGPSVQTHPDPGDSVLIVNPFSQPPSAVVWLMRTATVRALGGFDERFWPASAEDLDLAFTVWINELDIVTDTRVRVGHIGKGTATEKLDSWRQVWKRNGEMLLDKWSDTDEQKPRLDSVDQVRHARNTAIAASMALWMRRYYDLRERRFRGRLLVDRAISRGEAARRRLVTRLTDGGKTHRQ
ncbi:hypothetical protein BH24ACT15_BH24ACT15_28270 [soil metagenome]